MTTNQLIRLILPIQNEEKYLSQFKSPKKNEDLFFGNADEALPHTLEYLLDELQRDETLVAPLLTREAVLFNPLSCANFVNHQYLLNKSQDEDKANDALY